jgi:hypothetical protein
MEIAIAFVLGGLCGWAIASATRRSDKPRGQRTFRPNKRQRKILATLPPDPVRPSIHELVAAEAAELGVDQIPGADDVLLGVRLKVWKRDHEVAEPCDPALWRFVVAHNVVAAAATDTDVRLECGPPSDATPEPGNTD